MCATSHELDTVTRKLCYSLHLLIRVCCFISLRINDGRRHAAKGRVWALVIVELHPLSDTGFGL
jgi:hypothetical protein